MHPHELFRLLSSKISHSQHLAFIRSSKLDESGTRIIYTEMLITQKMKFTFIRSLIRTRARSQTDTVWMSCTIECICDALHLHLAYLHWLWR